MLFNAFLWCISNTMTFPLGQVYFLGDLYTLKSLKPPMLWRWLVSPAGTFAALDICRMVKGIHTLWNHGFLMSPATQQKLPAMVLCLGQPPVRYLWCWLLLLFFINFCFSCYFAMPATLDLGFWGPRRPPPALSSTLATFDCLCFFSSTASATVLSGHFLPTGVFYLALLPQHFWLNLRLSKPPWEPAVFPWSLQGFKLILEAQTRPVCLFDFLLIDLQRSTTLIFRRILFWILPNITMNYLW